MEEPLEFHFTNKFNLNTASKTDKSRGRQEYRSVQTCRHKNDLLKYRSKEINVLGFKQCDIQTKKLHWRYS